MFLGRLAEIIVLYREWQEEGDYAQPLKVQARATSKKYAGSGALRTCALICQDVTRRLGPTARQADRSAGRPRQKAGYAKKRIEPLNERQLWYPVARSTQIANPNGDVWIVFSFFSSPGPQTAQDKGLD